LKVKINSDILEASQLNSDAYPPHYNLAKGFTVFGEACKDECTYREGYPYTWCHKVAPSKIGTWSGSDYCTSNHKMTHQVGSLIRHILQRKLFKINIGIFVTFCLLKMLIVWMLQAAEIGHPFKSKVHYFRVIGFKRS
jgi:hypothetical protein